MSIILVKEFAEVPLQKILLNNRNNIKQQAYKHLGIKEEDEVIQIKLLRAETFEDVSFESIHHKKKDSTGPNIRATRLAMSFGHYNIRYYGPVLFFLSGGCKYLEMEDLFYPCCISPDFRTSIVKELADSTPKIPDWLLNAAQNKYLDDHVLSRLAQIMAIEEEETEAENGSFIETNKGKYPKEEKSLVVAHSPLCFHCRCPATKLCDECNAVYFCDAKCQVNCWSHLCQCKTWKLYEKRRTELSYITKLSSWACNLMTRENQLSQIPYYEFLKKSYDITAENSKWWKTELTGGWNGGNSISDIDVTDRMTFQQGFTPLPNSLIPPDQPVSKEEYQSRILEKNKCGLLRLTKWEDYYQLRSIPLLSPVALLLTFPLTLYHSLVTYGEAACIVALQISQRPLRIHVVGVEKELNFIDLFKEVLYLMIPAFDNKISIEITLVVRKDMLPKEAQHVGCYDFKCTIQNHTLHFFLITGTYGETINPNFDCTGAPDFIMAFNAGIYAYSSWKYVVQYLYQHKNVTGIFTDYNEVSGVACASIGGAKARESLVMNPFRQPRAMPVYSMNLPQFSNGWIYVFNEQVIDD